MPKILQTGTYSASNKGDATLQLVTARMLSRHVGDAHITISCPFPEQDATAYRPFAVSGTSRRNLVTGTVLLLRALLWRTLQNVGIDWAGLIAHPELRAFHSADLVVDVSGDMLTEDYGPHVAYSHFLPILTALALKRPVMIMAQSVGPFSLTRPLARLMLNRVDRITVRDELTVDQLRSLRLTNTSVELTADVAFCLEAADAARAEAIMVEEGISIGDRPLLGVAVSRLIAQKFWRKANDTAKHATFQDFFANLLDEAARTLGADVVFIPHVLGPRNSADDRILSSEIAARMQSQAHVIHGDYHPEETKAVIARCALFLGSRMHANIAALTSGVPAVAVSYSHKMPGVFDRLGVGEFVCPLTDLTQDHILQLLERASEQRKEVHAQISAHLPDLERRAIRNFDIAADLLSERAGGRQCEVNPAPAERSE